MSLSGSWSCWPQVCRDDTKQVVHCDVIHLYFLIDLLKHPRDDILPLHRLDLISSWPDILQKYLLALCINSWGKHVTSEKFPLTPIFIIVQSGLFLPVVQTKTESLLMGHISIN